MAGAPNGKAAGAAAGAFAGIAHRAAQAGALHGVCACVRVCGRRKALEALQARLQQQEEVLGINLKDGKAEGKGIGKLGLTLPQMQVRGRVWAVGSCSGADGRRVATGHRMARAWW